LRHVTRPHHQHHKPKAAHTSNATCCLSNKTHTSNTLLHTVAHKHTYTLTILRSTSHLNGTSRMQHTAAVCATTTAESYIVPQL
jgi:hypothetical protein